MRSRLLQGLVLLAPVAFTTGCLSDAESNTAEAAPADVAPVETPVANRVTVTAADFYFKAPSTIPAGLTSIQLVNQGPELHHVQLVRLAEGRTMKDLIDAVGGGHQIPAWVELVGGPNTPAPGGESEATLNLEPGDYAMICVIPSKDGVPHFMKGMVLPITVTPTAGRSTVEPAADVVMSLADYSFDMATPLQSGRRTIRVENVADQPHEVILVQLAPGKTAGEMLEWLHKMDGPPPGKPIGGTTLLGKGEVNHVTADFQPGEYALLCMVPDAKDGQPHVAHGMIRQISVR